MATPKTRDNASPADHTLTAMWERWWAGIDGTPGEIVWDADPGDLQVDLDHFADSFGQALPMADFGCGDGRQTRFLARHFPDVLGVDLSAAAIGRARAADNPPNVAFQVLHACDPVGATRLHQELGDANVYIRGVLQALPPASRPRAVQSIRVLLGAAGMLVAKGLPPQAADYFASVTRRHGLPPGLAKVMRHIPPGQISLPDLGPPVPRGPLRGARHRDQPHAHRHTLPTGEVIMVPAIWALIRPRRSG